MFWSFLLLIKSSPGSVFLMLYVYGSRLNNEIWRILKNAIVRTRVADPGLFYPSVSGIRIREFFSGSRIRPLFWVKFSYIILRILVVFFMKLGYSLTLLLKPFLLRTQDPDEKILGSEFGIKHPESATLVLTYYLPYS
jgi:hypothetical protein